MQIITFPVTLIKSFMISPKVKHFILTCDTESVFQFKPGQFITIHFTIDGKPLRRSYSIANEPKQDNRIEIAAGYVDDGPGTKLLFNLKPGDSLQINGPYGRLVLKENTPKRYIFVATSTGITPFRAMLGELGHRLQQNTNLTAVILQGVQKSEEVLYKADFLNFIQQYPQVSFYPYLSREPVNQLKDDEYSGYVQLAFNKLELKPEEDVVYLCGNPSMIDDAFEQLKTLGFTTQQVIREKYISN
ncbi:MAG: ferredoxin--NADP reductase [Legionella sp.]|nr:ferredoxin--NADP reductase [Legionella sp.]